MGSNIHLYTSDTKKSSSNFDTTNVRVLEEMEEKGEKIAETMRTSAKVILFSVTKGFYSRYLVERFWLLML